ncbi:unnamed protein product [Choristocarpus tenellus]
MHLHGAELTFLCIFVAVARPIAAFQVRSPLFRVDSCSVVDAFHCSRVRASTFQRLQKSLNGMIPAMETSRRGHREEVGEGECDIYTLADLDKFSSPWGITLHYSNTLNVYRIEARRQSGEVAGYTTGFHYGNLLHLDTMQTQRKSSAYAPGAPNAPPPDRDIPWIARSESGFQLGAVLGCAALRYGWERGARRVELLAIKDLQNQHRRLVRYYRMAGFREVREVGDDLESFKDRLVWGGVGTLMEANVEKFMGRWTPVIHGGATSMGSKDHTPTTTTSGA